MFMACTINEKLFNQYLKPYWQDNIQDDETWNDIKNIPNKELWDTHTDRKKNYLL